jgi:hypothetical protein
MTLAEVKDIFSKNFISTSVYLQRSDRTITDALSHMIGTYIVKSGGEYTFIHDSILEVVSHHYGKDYPRQILKYKH